MILDNLKNIQTAFAFIRKAAITALAASAATVAVTVIAAYIFAERQREKIYVLDEGKSLILALRQDAAENRPAEAREHVRRFHELFFTLTPDRTLMEENISRALEMADRSAYDCYTDIAEKGYYRRIVSADIVQNIKIDSIALDLESHPFHVTTWATQRIIRQSNITRRLLITECYLRNTPRSQSNPGGFRLEGFRIIQNTDIETTEK